MEYEPYSVLMSVYRKDSPAYFRQSVESMLNQTVPPDEIVIVRNGSLTEELENVLRGLSEKNPCVRPCGYEQNKGLGYALNYGLRMCRNELIARMDADDISLPDRCYQELEAFRDDSELGIVGTDIAEFQDTPENIFGVKRMPQTPEEIFDYGKRRNPFNHPTVMYRKSLIQAMGGYSESNRGEDFRLFTRMISDGVRGRNLPKALVLYRADSGQFRRRTSWTDTKAVIRVVLDNWKRGYTSVWALAYVIATQLAGFLLPSAVGRFFYRKLFLKAERTP